MPIDSISPIISRLRQQRYKNEWRRRKRAEFRDANPLPLSPRKAAQTIGKTRYFTGKPCPAGHIAERLVSSGGCIICAAIRRQRMLSPTVEKKRQYRHHYSITHSVQITDRVRRWRRHNQARARQLNRISSNRYRARRSNPVWANQQAIADVYDACPAGMHVDHIVPLNGITVDGYPICGLHVPWNLQYLTREQNIRKRNRMQPEEH
jgi:hypothetical protein